MEPKHNGNGDGRAGAAASTASAEEIIDLLRQDIENGRHWYLALLEAIGRWSLPEETFQGRHFQYLIAQEAFDWLLLAERLCLEVDSLIPDQEETGLLFAGEPPIDLPAEEFKDLIGPVKYRAHLNFLYGVTVEEALINAVEQDVLKEQLSSCVKDSRIFEDIYQRIYRSTQSELLQRFREEQGREQVPSIGLDELKEFTYWLFKHRLRHCDKARVAADTRKALDHLQRQRELRGQRQQLLAEAAAEAAQIIQ